MKVWIDLANSPHPLLFAPVSRRLRAEGHEVLLTARDNAQTVELALERWADTEVIGTESPRGKAAKARLLARRITDLRRWAAGRRPDVALSHNSYAQIVAAWTLRIPAVTAMDFEHQPANHLAFRLAHTVLLPEILPLRSVRMKGASPHKVRRYPGLKEELYIGDLHLDDSILPKVGLRTRPEVVAVVRTPPTRAIYHPAANALFETVLRVICMQPAVTCIVLPRHPEQRTWTTRLNLPNCVVPVKAIDSRSLLYAADVMIGAGGTMTREAALMGIPTWTMFAGTPPAVDRWLEQQGRLLRLTDPAQLGKLAPRQTEPHTPDELRERGAAIERAFVDAAVGSRRRELLGSPA